MIWNAHLLNSTEPALNLNEVSVVEGIFMDAAAHVTDTKDYLLPSQLNMLTPEQYMAAATSAANLNILIDSAENSTSFAKSAYYTQDQVRCLAAPCRCASYLQPAAASLASGIWRCRSSDLRCLPTLACCMHQQAA